MRRIDLLRSGLALAIIILGSLQAWDSNVHLGGLLVVFLVSTALALPAVAIQAPVRPTYFLAAVAVSLLLLLIARLASPVSLPGLFLVLLPSAIGVIFIGTIANKHDKNTGLDSR